MRVSEDRFSQHEALFRGADDVLRTAKVYTYEATTGLYDVLVIEGMRFVRVDMGKPSNLITAWKPHHYAIEKHFGLA